MDAAFCTRPAPVVARIDVHHAVRTVKLQLQDGTDTTTRGRWIIEGDLAMREWAHVGRPAASVLVGNLPCLDGDRQTSISRKIG
ncbi:hypothetical protein MCHK_11275 (plasmid) [Mesorhizobium huakuii 7653R]|nr:hypothetical protein MCHK_11275 [Mesorhizobium huakuii 7653R]